MKLLLVCLLALSALGFIFSCGPSFEEEAIQSGKPVVGMYGDQLAHINNFPYTVSTFVDGKALLSGSGAILNANWILTTASQHNSQPAENITVRGGSDDGTKGGQFSRISKLITNYTEFFSINLALLKTKTKLVFNKNLKPIKLAKTLPKEGSMANMSGFGRNSIHYGMLNVAHFSISNYSACQLYYHSNTLVCSESEKYLPAFDDNGSPLVQNKQLVGIFVDCYEGPFAFMAIPKLRDWIIQTIMDNSEGDEAFRIDDYDV